MRQTPRTRLLAASVAALATFAFAACGGDDDDDTTDASDVTLSTVVDETTSPGDTTTDATIAPDESTDATSSSTGGGEVGARDEYVDAAREQLPIEDDDIRGCVAEALVSDEVYAAIQDAGMSVETFTSDGPGELDLDEAAAQGVGDGLAACGDITSQFAAEASETQVECLRDNMDDEQIATALAFEILDVDAPADLQAAQDAVDECADAATTTTG